MGPLEWIEERRHLGEFGLEALDVGSAGFGQRVEQDDQAVLVGRDPGTELSAEPPFDLAFSFFQFAPLDGEVGHRRSQALRLFGVERQLFGGPRHESLLDLPHELLAAGPVRPLLAGEGRYHQQQRQQTNGRNVPEHHRGHPSHA